MGRSSQEPTGIWQLRRLIYEHFAASGAPPPRAAIVETVGGKSSADRLLAEMHDRHMVVLDATGEIRMALPFSAAPTGFSVRARRRRWMANCAWDALAIPIAVGHGDPIDVRIDARWCDTNQAVDLVVIDGALSNVDGFVHFHVRASRWWDDIVHT